MITYLVEFLSVINRHILEIVGGFIVVLGGIIVVLFCTYFLSAKKSINEGNEAIVERLGQYHRTLNSGVSFIVPFIDQIVMENTIRKQILEMKPMSVLTKDRIAIELWIIIQWQIIDIKKTFYEIDDLQISLTSLSVCKIREVIADKNFEELLIYQDSIAARILDSLNKLTKNWGVDILTINIEAIYLPEAIQKVLEEGFIAIIDTKNSIEIAKLQAEAEKLGIHISKEDSRKYIRNVKDIISFLPRQLQLIIGNQNFGSQSNAEIKAMN
ncbi:SPFH domain-containing protein [Calothrix sp. 336/3]|uniref:SPFH domain-containing protein n=1 Tax=Calothrix sp. 336/3 TaxID=1337936 RepID=UPI00069A2AEC|nr:SPFH domain-containing protein [Calothrix sp. 336/3]